MFLVARTVRRRGGLRLPLQISKRTSVGTSSWFNFFHPKSERAAFEKWIKPYNPRAAEVTSVFGKWVECQRHNTRVAFLIDRIYIGNFDPTLVTNASYDLSRIPGTVPLEEERLTPYVPANLPDASTFLSQYSSLLLPEHTEHDWPALADPAVISNLIKFSQAVHGVKIMQNHSGIVLAYLFEKVGQQDQLDNDLDLATEVYKAVEKYGNDEKYPRKERKPRAS